MTVEYFNFFQNKLFSKLNTPPEKILILVFDIMSNMHAAQHIMRCEAQDPSGTKNMDMK